MFHFNKKHLEDPTIPMWIVMAKGQTYYVEHVEANIAWSTKETPDNTRTKGAIKFRECLVNIGEDNVATITKLTRADEIRLRNSERGITRLQIYHQPKWQDMLDRLGIKHGPIKRFSGGCGRQYYVIDILSKEDMMLLSLGADQPNMYRIISPNENLYKMYDDPHLAATHDPDIDDDPEDLYEE